MKDTIEIDPIYQRQGEVWTTAKQQLLIDSVINNFDIPKIYFHEHLTPIEVDGRRVRYSLVDGRQRLEAVWDYLEDKFGLSDDFKYLEDESTDASGLHYSELQIKFPDMAALFSATSLDVMLIRTSDIELIEEMFSRLNEAVPLNAAEKRNGRGGPLREIVRNLADENAFFKDRIPFNNTRYRHFDLATKFLLWSARGGPTDVKKRPLDEFWETTRKGSLGAEQAAKLNDSVVAVLESMSGTFESKDRLLRNIGMVSVYYLLFQDLLKEEVDLPSRADLVRFDLARQVPRVASEDELTSAQRDFVEFDRLAQSPNDESALRFRLRVIKDYLKGIHTDSDSDG
jgi:hypothetical protein